jgi:hypothetical protein
MMQVNREIRAFGLDGREHRFSVPATAQKSESPNNILWTWKDDEGIRRRLGISLYGIVFYEEVLPA